MAYYLEFDGVNDYVTTGLAPTVSGTFEVEVEFATNSTARQALWHGEESGQLELNRFGTGILNGFIKTADGSWVGVTASTPIAFGDRVVAKLTYNKVNFKLFIDDVEVGSTSETRDLYASQTYNFGGHRLNGNYPFVGDFYSGRIQVNANDYVYSPSASGGTGLVLPETTGTYDGTLVNFPTDGSQWVYYDAGGGADVASTVTANVASLGAVAVNGGIEQEAPATNPISVVDVNIPALGSVSASSNVSVPRNNVLASTAFSVVPLGEVTPTASVNVLAGTISSSIEAFISSLGSVSVASDIENLAEDVVVSVTVDIPALSGVSVGSGVSVLADSNLVTASVTVPSLGEVTSSLGITKEANDVAGTVEVSVAALGNITTASTASVPLIERIASGTVSIAALSDVSGSITVEQTVPAAGGLTVQNINDIALAVRNILLQDFLEITNKTDQLTFTKANELDVNQKSINDYEVHGSGTDSDKWRGTL